MGVYIVYWFNDGNEKYEKENVIVFYCGFLNRFVDVVVGERNKVCESSVCMVK